MEQPKETLKEGTRIVTHAKMYEADDIRVAYTHLSERRANAPGIIKGVVGGHGGDVYWVAHDNDPADTPWAPYCFDEFELEESVVH